MLKNNVKKILEINKVFWKHAYFYEIVIFLFYLSMHVCG
jgi:hypothetical protein